MLRAWRWICSSRTAICGCPIVFAGNCSRYIVSRYNNIKKHAKASHVVVKLAQDEAKVSLVVDDNGRGFSFSGRYTAKSWTGCDSGQFRSRKEHGAWAGR